MDGGIVVGKSHAQGGEKFIVEGTGQHVELEAEEIVICVEAYDSDEIHEFTDTPYNILMAIQRHYGCNTGKVTDIAPEEYVICKKVIRDKEPQHIKGTVREIIDELQGQQGCVVSHNSCKTGKCNHKKEDGGSIGPSKTDIVLASTTRNRPYETIIFDPPIIGKNGNKLISYTWAYEWIEDWNEAKGETVTKRISDWTQAENSDNTGRELVHQYKVEQANGKIETVSAESVLELLGFVTPNDKLKPKSIISASKTLAKLRMELSIAQIKQQQYDDAKRKLIDGEKPAIILAERREDEHGGVSIFEMGNARVWQMDESVMNWDTGKNTYKATTEINDERKDVLTNSWIEKQLQKAGLYKQKVGELAYKVANQQKKLEKLTNSTIVAEKKSSGGPVSSPNSIIYTSEFKAWFGDWEALKKARELAATHDHWYMRMITIPEKSERVLFELAQQANSSESEKKTATLLAGQEIMDCALALYPNVTINDEFYPAVSKVVDEKGEPLVVYHGTSTKMDLLPDTEKAFYFSKNKDYAENFAQFFANENGGKPLVKEVFLNIRKPHIWKNETVHFLRVNKKIEDVEYASKYDGIIGVDSGPNDSKNRDTFVVFSKEQIYPLDNEKFEMGGQISGITPAQFIKKIEVETGLKIASKKEPLNSSMRGYLIIRPRKSGNVYPSFNFEYIRDLKNQFPGVEPNPNFFSVDTISLYFGNELYNDVDTQMNTINPPQIKILPGESFTGKIVLLKNTDSAPYLGKRFAQDVEPSGFYATQKYNNALDALPNYKTFIADIKKPLIIDVTNDLVEWKRDLSKKYKAKNKSLSSKLIQEGYDSIITTDKNGQLGEIIILTPNQTLIEQKRFADGGPITSPTHLLPDLENSLNELNQQIIQFDEDIKASNEAEANLIGDAKFAEMKKRTELRDSKREIERKIIFRQNQIHALQSGGVLATFTDKKDTEHVGVPDFTHISTEEIIFDEDTILQDVPPPYIPLIHETRFKEKGFIFDCVRFANNSYLLAGNGFTESTVKPKLAEYSYTKKNFEPKEFPALPAASDEYNGYIIVTLDQLALISDYYFTKEKAKIKADAAARNKRAEENYDKLPRERRLKHFDQPGFYRVLPVAVKKKITQEDWDKLLLEEKETYYKPIAKTQGKRLQRDLALNTMPSSFHAMYERFVDAAARPYKKREGKLVQLLPNDPETFGRIAHADVWAYWDWFRRMMEWKIKDLAVQRQFLSDTRALALETSFGISNTSNALLQQYGILVKRQNGDEIKPVQIDQIRTAWENINKLFFNLTGIARKQQLKISHTGTTLVFASKAAGMYIPYMASIAVSAKFGDDQFQNIFAHEVAHFIDHMLGSSTGQRYATDDYESTAGKLAFVFRQNMNVKSQSDYYNSTKECFARAMEQYFAITTFGIDASLVFYSSQPDRRRPYITEDAYVGKESFELVIKPLVEQFLAENFTFFNEQNADELTLVENIEQSSDDSNVKNCEINKEPISLPIQNKPSGEIKSTSMQKSIEELVDYELGRYAQIGDVYSETDEAHNGSNEIFNRLYQEYDYDPENSADHEYILGATPVEILQYVKNTILPRLYNPHLQKGDADFNAVKAKILTQLAAENPNKTSVQSKLHSLKSIATKYPELYIDFMNFVLQLPKKYQIVINPYDEQGDAGVTNFLAQNGINLFDYLPVKEYALPKAKAFETSKDDKVFMDIHTEFVGYDDNLRANLLGSNFGEKGVATTDANVFLFTPYRGIKPAELGTFCHTKKCLENEDKVTNSTFPSYENIIPVNSFKTFINTAGIYNFCKNAEKLELVGYDKYHNAIGIIYKDLGLQFGLPVQSLLSAIKTLAELGHNQLEMSFPAENHKGILLYPHQAADKVKTLETDFVLFHPLRLDTYGKKFYVNINVENGCATFTGIEKEFCFDLAHMENIRKEKKHAEIEAKLTETQAELETFKEEAKRKDAEREAEKLREKEEKQARITLKKEKDAVREKIDEFIGLL